MINGKQHIVRFHVYDILSSGVDKTINDDLHTWLDLKFGQLKNSTVSWGKGHKFLGMNLNFSEKYKFHVTQNLHVRDIIYACPIKISKDATATSPAENNIICRGDSILLNEKGQDAFQTCITKGIFIEKRSCPDIQPIVSVFLG